MATTICAYLLIGFFFFMEDRLRQGQEAKSLQAGEHDQGSTKLIGCAFAVTFITLLVAPILNSFQIGSISNGLWVGVLGLVMMIVGLALRYWASKTLGAFYTRTLLVKTEHQIVDSGPYRLIRNPGYLGDITLFVGAGLATFNWIAVVSIANALLIAYVYRIRTEEAMLQLTFGEQYAVYMTHSWRLIPLIY